MRWPHRVRVLQEAPRRRLEALGARGPAAVHRADARGDLQALLLIGHHRRRPHLRHELKAELSCGANGDAASFCARGSAKKSRELAKAASTSSLGMPWFTTVKKPTGRGRLPERGRARGVVHAQVDHGHPRDASALDSAPPTPDANSARSSATSASTAAERAARALGHLSLRLAGGARDWPAFVRRRLEA